ncbi:hypothetical protein SISSUDRAFT_1049929, partial [Sistotremastrum suecicum HHB10207 ss-3]
MFLRPAATTASSPDVLDASTLARPFLWAVSRPQTSIGLLSVVFSLFRVQALNQAGGECSRRATSTIDQILEAMRNTVEGPSKSFHMFSMISMHFPLIHPRKSPSRVYRVCR